MIAHCPKCHTEYTLSDEQLAAAQGQVRCGACMTVFKAIDNRQKDKVVTSRFVGDGELIQDDDNDLFEQDPFITSLNNVDTNSDVFGALDDEVHSHHQDEGWANDLLKELEPSPEKTIQPTPQPTEKPPSSDITSLTSDVLDDLSDLDDLTLKPEEQAVLSDSGQNKNHLRQRIEAEPIEFQYKNKRKFGPNFFYGCASLLLIATAFGQMAFFKFDDLSKTAQWRPIYTKLCTYIHCQIPARIDTDKINVSHLNVKSHPYLKGILIVDLILTNQAAFDQPFPTLELFFTDQEQSVIAGRPLPPKTYLRGDLATNQPLPQRQPIHIAIEVVDPGNTASGYFIQISAAEKNDRVSLKQTI